MSRPLALLASLGELLVLAGAVCWLPCPVWGKRLFAVGALFFALGRLLGSQGDYAQSTCPDHSPRLRRLFRQRMAGTVMLLLAALAMCHGRGFFLGTYVPHAAWLIPSIPFTAIELYTAFQIPRLMRE